MTLIEIIIAMFILAVAILALITVMTSASTLQQVTREQAIAYNHARKVLEEMRSEPVFLDVYKRYNSITSDDPADSESPGNTFHVAELAAPKSGAPTGWTDGYGEISFPEAANQPGVLSEQAGDAAMGMPKDLNRDGDDDDTNVTSDHKILPVKIVIRWRSIGNRDSRIELNSFITER